jgi:hypothetical protein
MSTIDITVGAILREALDGPRNPPAGQGAENLAAALLRMTFFPVEDRCKELAARAKALPPEQQAHLVVEAARQGAQREEVSYILQPLISSVLRRKLEFSEAQILDLLACLQQWRFGGPLLPVLSMIGQHSITPDIAAALGRLRSHPWLHSGYADVREVNQRLDQMLGLRVADNSFHAAGSWSKRVQESIQGQAAEGPITELLLSGADIRGSAASKKWRLAAKAVIEQAGRDEFRRLALDWLALGPDPAARGFQVESAENDYQRALLWALTDYSDREICAAVAAFAERCLKKIPNLGPVAQKAGNACVNVLAHMPGNEPLGQLVRLGMRIKYQTAQRLIHRALEEAAERAGLSREELEEISVPDLGLDAQGARSESIAGYCAEFNIRQTSVAYRNPQGKVVSALPAAVRKEHSDAVKRIVAAAKDVDKMLLAQRLRIERLLMTERSISLETWRKHYLEHPLLQDLTRRLVWRFRWEGREHSAIAREGALTEWNGRPVEPPAGAQVQLWHPIDSDVQTTLSWRCRLEDDQIQQPFKQAHREVYLLTAAERETRLYSNRFAAHILRQHQFKALAESRGWRFSLMGMWDSHNVPYLELPQHGVQVEFHLEEGGMEDHSAHGIYLYLVSDQVRFVDSQSHQPRPLDEIPPRLFSEVMRDVDLFVSVASVGSDASWSPGRFERLDQYWESFSFGELSVSAQSRRDTIERLLPKLPIRDRCRLEDRFLVVTGTRATYKIHLGSGNILMEPGSRYLCIVRGPSTNKTPSRVFLPFEGDNTLSLILSKAFLLADDAKIKDPTILQQLPG